MYANPMVVAKVNGIANQIKPPKKKPQIPCRGLAATLLCQYAWSANTVPKLPLTFQIDKRLSKLKLRQRGNKWIEAFQNSLVFQVQI